VIPLWRPEYVPTAVMLAKAPDSITQAGAIDSILQSKAIAQWDAGDGLHIRLPDGHQLWILDKSPGAPLAVVIPLDENFLLRAAGAVRFRQLLADSKAGPPPPAQQLTPRYRKRLIEILRTLDARRSDATYREIANVLLGPQAGKEKGWKTHPIRAKVIRLFNDGAALVNLGYLKLVRGRSAD